MQSKIYLIRHGETQWNGERRIQGHKDIPLNEKGREQARLKRDLVRKFSIDVVYSSDLSRAQETAAILFPEHPEIYTDPRARERKLGIWEGRKFQELIDTHGYPFHIEGVPEEGIENIHDAFVRISSLLQDITRQHNGKNAALVTHGGVMKRFLIHRHGKETGQQFSVENLRVLPVEVSMKENFMIHVGDLI